jgi:hypothetical protein
MQKWLKENHAPAWAALIAFALIAFWISAGTAYHQLAIGVLAAAVTLLVVMLVFEALWWIGVAAFGSPGGNSGKRGT